MTALTASLLNVRRIADEALERPEGLTITFHTRDYESLEQANTKARGFQTSFSALRTRERKQRQRRVRNVLVPDDDVVGLYDALACQKLPMPNGEGFAVHLIPETALRFDDNVIDRATGEPIEMFDADTRMLRKIVKKVFDVDRAVKKGGTWYNPLNPTEIQFMLDKYPQDYADWGMTPQPAAYDPTQPVKDLADIPLDQMFGDDTNDA